MLNGVNGVNGVKLENKVKITLYTDGACSGNPGPGGYGAILVYVDSLGQTHEKALSAGYKCVTNNQMELLAVIVGIEAIKKPADITVISDSKYVCDAFNNNWIDSWVKRGWKNSDKKPVKNQELWQRLLNALKEHSVNFVWVKGHAGHQYNERCDKMAVEAYKQDVLIENIT